jgi:hypothetical protein
VSGFSGLPGFIHCKCSNTYGTKHNWSMRPIINFHEMSDTESSSDVECLIERALQQSPQQSPQQSMKVLKKKVRNDSKDPSMKERKEVSKGEKKEKEVSKGKRKEKEEKGERKEKEVWKGERTEKEVSKGERKENGGSLKGGKMKKSQKESKKGGVNGRGIDKRKLELELCVSRANLALCNHIVEMDRKTWEKKKASHLAFVSASMKKIEERRMEEKDEEMMMDE